MGLTSRYSGPAAITAEGWAVERVTRPSKLAGANGMKLGADGRVYVASVAGSQVTALDVETGEIEIISGKGGPIIGPDDLTFDEAGNLYVTEITEDQVRMLAPNGTSRVIQGDMPVANPITYHQGRLIAGELNMQGRILELDRDGGAPRVIASGLPMVNAFDVGPDGKLYFPAQAANEIWRVDLDSGEIEVVAKELGVPDSVKFHPDGYIVSSQVYSGQVLKIDPRTGEKTVLADIGPGLDCSVFVNGRTFVSSINGSITEIVAPGVTRPLIEQGLQWPLGIALGEDGTLFVGDGGFAYTVPAGGEMAFAGCLFTPSFPGWVRGSVASGPGEWIVTTADGDVARWNPAAQESEKLSSGYEVLTGVALAGSGAVVFADAGAGKVRVIEGGNVSELAAGLDKPMGVAVGPDGAVYVAESDAGRVVKLAGGRTETVLDGLGQPEGIAVRDGKLSVVDVKAKELVQSDLAGGNREVVASNLPVGAPMGVTPTTLRGVSGFCGPMWTFTGIAAGPDGTIYVAGDGEGSVLAVKPA
ncbi:MAG: SMP-30/gluconolactonase/LRE family protein [Novosphingobium sp.]